MLYDRAIEGMKKRLMKKSPNGKLTYIAEQNGGSLIHKMDHLVLLPLSISFIFSNLWQFILKVPL
jgi:hypothetical protein